VTVTVPVATFTTMELAPTASERVMVWAASSSTAERPSSLRQILVVHSAGWPGGFSGSSPVPQ
jgi:hypothetical protein